MEMQNIRNGSHVPEDFEIAMPSRAEFSVSSPERSPRSPTIVQENAAADDNPQRSPEPSDQPSVALGATTPTSDPDLIDFTSPAPLLPVPVPQDEEPTPKPKKQPQDMTWIETEENYRKIIAQEDALILKLSNEISELEIQGASANEHFQEEQDTQSRLKSEHRRLQTELDIAQKENELMKLECDHYQQELNSIEDAFSKIFKAYERAKENVENLKTNEKTFRAREPLLLSKITRREAHLEHIRKVAAETEETLRKDQESRLAAVMEENIKLQGKLRLTQIKSNKLEGEIQQVQKNTDALISLCNDMIS